MSCCLPFNIEEVVAMFPIETRTPTTGPAIYANCPFCGGKGTLHIHSEKGVWNCPRCSHGGGILDFYIAMNHMEGVDARKEAYRDICRYLNIENPRQQAINCREEKQNYPITKGKGRHLHTCELTNIVNLHRTYNTLLNILELTDTHKSLLMARGLTEEEIEGERFRSVPTINQQAIVEALLRFGCNFNGVPGFYYEEPGGWKMNFGNRSGILVPYMNKEGFIVGMQIRSDLPFHSSQKYIWFSSVNKEYGCSSGSPIHYVGDPLAEKVVLTEGGLKGTVAHLLSKRLGLPLSFVCIAGVTQYNSVRSLFQELRNCGCQVVYEALDMDKYKNSNVFKSLQKIYQIGEEEGLTVIPYNWNAVEIKWVKKDGETLLKTGDTYKIFCQTLGEYFSCSLGGTQSYDTFAVNSEGILTIPEPLIWDKRKEDMEYSLIHTGTGESTHFRMPYGKDYLKLPQEDSTLKIYSYKGIDDYFWHLTTVKRSPLPL